MSIVVRRPDFVDIDPRIPFGLIAQFNLQALAVDAAAHSKDHFRVSLVAPPKPVAAKFEPSDDAAEPEEIERYDVGFILVPVKKTRPTDGFFARGVRVECSNMIEAQALAQKMFEWNTSRS